MHDERRRYFRINETIGVGYERLEAHHPQMSDDQASESRMADILDVVEKQDAQIEQLLVELEDDHPKVVELITAFNQKLERVVKHLLMDSQLIKRIARKLKEVNISACGLAFNADEAIEPGENLRLQLTLYPEEQRLETLARVVNCEAREDSKGYFWRLDFYGMKKKDQETLIQHIVRSQGMQLRKL